MLMEFRRLRLGPMANFVYLLADPTSKDCAVVDPAWEVPSILEAIRKEGWRLAGVFVTHRHPDHINGLAELLRSCDVPVYAHPLESPAAWAPGKNLRPSRNGDAVRLGSIEVGLLHTPGHTPDSQCLLAGGRLFSGDTLFVGSCGRVDLEGSDPEQLYASLKRLASLPEETVVHPGHQYSDAPESTLRAQLQGNPYLQAAAAGPLSDFLRLVGA